MLAATKFSNHADEIGFVCLTFHVMTAHGRYEVVGRHLRECMGRLVFGHSCASVHYIHIVVWVSKMQILPFCLLRLEQHFFFFQTGCIKDVNIYREDGLPKNRRRNCSFSSS